MSATLRMDEPEVNEAPHTGIQEAADSVPGEVARTGARTLPAALKPHLWKPGQSGNPGGSQGRVGAMRKIAAEKTVSAIQTLIAVMEDPKEDGRVRVVAAQAVLDRGAGKVTELVPTAPPAMTLDLARLSADQLAALRAILDSGAFVPAPEPASDEPPTIDGSAS